MRGDTREQIDRLSDLGHLLGFQTQREYVSPWHPGDRDLAANRHDVVWCLDLPPVLRETLQWATAQRAPAQIPIVGFEVEGTAPNTKVMAMDALGLAAAGIPLGVLVVSDRRPADCKPGSKTGRAGGENNIFRRAARILRSLRHGLGSLNVFCLDASWLEALESKLARAALPSAVRAAHGPASAGAGGERDEAGILRSELRNRGTAAGLRVVEDWTPPTVAASEAEFLRLARPDFGFTDDPFDLGCTLRKGAFTRSKIDVAWMLSVPPGLAAWLEIVTQHYPDARSLHGIHSDTWSELPLVGFELENGNGKHASGGMISLHSHCLFGVTVGYGSADVSGLARQLAWLKHAFGLPRVRVQEATAWMP